MQYNGSAEELTLQESEVEKMEYIDSAKLEKDLNDPDENKKYVGHGSHYGEIIAAVRSILKESE